MKKLLSILAISLFIASCEFTFNTGMELPAPDFGEMPIVNKETFNNIYVADEGVCEGKELPPTRFAIEYPDSLEVDFPDNERDHITIKKKVNGIFTEELAIGNSTVTLNKKMLAGNLMENLVENLKQQMPDMQVDFIGKKKFKGELVHMMQGVIDFTGNEAAGYTGNYKMIILLSLPKEQKDMNGVLVNFIANEDSEIQSFDDFENSGMINEVWSTFRYVE